MAKSLLTLLAGLLIQFSAFGQSTSVTLQPAWESDTTLRTPESVLVDPKQNVLYVACINGAPRLDNTIPAATLLK